MKKILSYTIKVGLPLLLGGAILYWMYRGFDFEQVRRVVTEEMNWTWMLLSLPFGVLAQVFRALRWKQTLAPLGEKPRTDNAIYSIFLSYATSLVVPRVGEFVRCGVLKRTDGVSFSKALGTVLTERAVDTLMMMMMTVMAILLQLPVFSSFFARTGTRLDTLLASFTSTGYLVTAICALAVIVLLVMLMRRLAIFNKVKGVMRNIWQGVASLRNINGRALYLFYTFAIWFSYFLHFMLTFYCFEATAHLGVSCAFVSFVVGTIAVIVPTPNGAGPWHFAVKTMLILYGVQSDAALFFVLIVHTVQTLLVVLLGIWAAIFIRRRKQSILTSESQMPDDTRASM
ncbi:MAG: flippase-like domain-containing protein [Prevotella sp.]|nr:flippase-like domain-containing protein [Prevotella sp.]